MIQRIQPNSRPSRNRIGSNARPTNLLDSILALDRKVMEVSMEMYSIPRQDMMRIRAENRRLHGALRKIRLALSGQAGQAIFAPASLSRRSRHSQPR